MPNQVQNDFSFQPALAVTQRPVKMEIEEPQPAENKALQTSFPPIVPSLPSQDPMELALEEEGESVERGTKREIHSDRASDEPALKLLSLEGNTTSFPTVQDDDSAGPHLGGSLTTHEPKGMKRKFDSEEALQDPTEPVPKR